MSEQILNNSSDNNFYENENDDEMINLDVCDVQLNLCFNDYELDNICRFCLTQGGEMKYIFEENNHIETMINLLSSNLELSPDDGLPGTICDNCLTKLTASVDFKQQIETADLTLRHYMEDDTQNKFPSINIEQLENELNNFHNFEQETIKSSAFKMAPNSKTTIEIQNEEISTVTTKDSETENELFKCNQCSATFTIKDDLDIHGSLHDSEDKFVCRKCTKEFCTYAKLKRHIATHFEDKPCKCDVCGMGFSEISSLTRHSRKHNDTTRERRYSCKYCDKKYYDSHSLMIHTRNHTGEKPWICNICEKSFIDLRLLNSHLRTHSNEKTYECDTCGKRFTHPSTLTTHIRTHTGDKPYVCGVCNKSFVQASNMNLHMRKHTGEKPFKCEICLFSFASSSTLTTHMQTHSEQKPYYCPVCNKNFTKRNLNVHMRIHLDQKPYKCTECFKNFRTNGQLLIHRRTHSRNINEIICNNCSKSFSNEMHLKEHLCDDNNVKDQQQLDKDNEDFKTKALEKSKKYEIRHKHEQEQYQKQSQHIQHTSNTNVSIENNLNNNVNIDLDDESEKLVDKLLASVTNSDARLFLSDETFKDGHR